MLPQENELRARGGRALARQRARVRRSPQAELTYLRGSEKNRSRNARRRRNRWRRRRYTPVQRERMVLCRYAVNSGYGDRQAPQKARQKCHDAARLARLRQQGARR